MIRRMLPALAVLALSSCDARVVDRTQFVVFVDTDAIVPFDPSDPMAPVGWDPMRSAPLFDRVHVDVTTPNGPCSACARDFDLTEERLSARTLSFGLPVSPDTTGYRLHVQIYRARFAVDVAPPPSTVIDQWADLPALAPHEVREITVTLATDDVGTVRDHVVPRNGRPPPTRTKWARATRVACAGSAKTDEACVPGGAFWMGHNGFLSSKSIPHIVVVSPFYVDTHEVTVGQYTSAGFPVDMKDPYGCPYARADRPLNCIPDAANAKDFCTRQGKDLPTEAQFEYMAGHLDSSTFVWGEGEPSCDDVLFGGIGCPVSPPIANRGKRDRLPLFDVEVIDLAGSVAELVRDWFAEGDAPCWASPNILTDPFCGEPSKQYLRSIRGGGIDANGSQGYTEVFDDASHMIASFRDWRQANNTSSNPTPIELYYVGFRCVRAT